MKNRLIIMPHYAKELIDQAVEAFIKVGKELGIISFDSDFFRIKIVKGCRVFIPTAFLYRVQFPQAKSEALLNCPEFMHVLNLILKFSWLNFYLIFECMMRLNYLI